MRSTLAVLIAILVLGTGRAQVVPDHLLCSKARDNREHRSFTLNADVPTFADGVSCVLKVPAKLMCLPATKFNVAPPPPGGGPNPGVDQSQQRGVLCYAVKCQAPVKEFLAVHDQFGVGTVGFSAPRILCAPASPSGAFLN
jgi:hypothetical protein